MIFFFHNVCDTRQLVIRPSSSVFFEKLVCLGVYVLFESIRLRCGAMISSLLKYLRYSSFNEHLIIDISCQGYMLVYVSFENSQLRRRVVIRFTMSVIPVIFNEHLIIYVTWQTCMQMVCIPMWSADLWMSFQVTMYFERGLRLWYDFSIPSLHVNSPSLSRWFVYFNVM